MNHRTCLTMKLLSFLVAASFASLAYATAPITDSISVRESNITPGQTITIDATSHDDDGNLQTFHFFTWGPNDGGWQYAGPVNATGGSQSTVTWNWTVPNTAGHYYIHFRTSDSDGTWDSNANQMTQFDAKWNQTVSSNDVTLTYGQSFTPSFNGGAGSGVWQWCVGGFTAWGGSASGTLVPPDMHAADSWAPPSISDSGHNYYFWVMKLEDATHWTSNYAGPYTLTVNKAGMTDPTSQSYTISVGQSWSPSISTPGSNGSGAAVFCVAGPTGFITGPWTPQPWEAGTYSLYVGQLADYNHQGNITDPSVGPMQLNFTPYTLTVNGSVSFSFSGGSYTYDGGTKSVSVSPNPGSATYNTSGTYSTSEAGTYTAYADGTGAYSGHGQYTWTIYKADQSTVSISPSSTTVSVGGSVTFTASGGDVSAYQWGGDASGTGSSKTVTFNTAGTRTVTVYRPGDSNHNDSNTATATITVNSTPTYTLTVVNGTGGGSGLVQGASRTITANAPPSGQVFNGWSLSGPGTIGSAGSASTSFTVGAGNATVTATYRALPPPSPTITSATSASGTVGSSFNYYITATNSPTSYGVSGLPAGLSVNTSTGLVSGTPASAGTYNATISASNAGGTGSATLTITIGAAAAIDLQIHRP